MTILHPLNRIKNEEIILPAIQRDFAWPTKRICRLLDSIMQGYPIGIALLWETYMDIQYRPFVPDLWPGQIHPIQDNSKKSKLQIVLDGQQRLQSLYSAFCGTYKGKSLCLDVLSGRHTFEASKQKYDFTFMDVADFQRWQSKRQAVWPGLPGPADSPQYFLKVADLLTYSIKEKTELRKQLAKKLELSDEDQERLEMNLSCLGEILSKNTNILKVSIIDENLPSDTSRRKTEAEVLEMFVRVNREGAPLSQSDLTFSILKLNWKESAVSLPQFVQQVNDGNSFVLDTDFVIRCLFAVSGLGTRFDTDLLRKPSTIERLRDNFPRCCDAIRSALDTVMRDCWCSRRDLIGGQGTLVPFVYYLFHTNDLSVPSGQMENFRKALYLFGFAKPFSRNVESRLRKFIRRELQPLAERRDDSFPFAAAVRWVKYWEGYATFGTDLLESNPALALHVVQGLNGSKAQYWRNAEELDHIFPRSVLSKRGFDDSEIDNLANLWILAKGKNMNKSNRPPAEYFEDVDEQEMKLAFIDRELLDYSTFRSFLKKRGSQILEHVKTRLDFSDKDFRTPSLTYRTPRRSLLKLPPVSITANMLACKFAKRRS
jgi:5-methylcytosine-specific restriction endonuclease McrA